MLSIEELAFAVARGGWPASIGIPAQAALSQAGEYLKALIQTDIYEIDDVSLQHRRFGLVSYTLFYCFSGTRYFRFILIPSFRVQGPQFAQILAHYS
jgi:hypothetical protein